jgi:hypothetical protein
MGKRLKYYFLLFIKILSLATVTMLVAGGLISLFYGKEIRQLMIAELNKNLSAPISVADFDFTVIRHFPNASFEMKEVFIHDAVEGKSKDTLLYAKHVSLMFNIMGVFSRNVSVNKILLSDGQLNIRIDSLGNGNYDIWRKSKDTTSKTLDIRHILLKDIHLTYDDRKDRHYYALQVYKSKLSGKFSSDNYILSTESDLFAEQLFIRKLNYVDHKKVTIKAELAVNTKTGKYTFGKSRIAIGEIIFDLGGNIINPPKEVVFDLAIKAYESKFGDFISVLPAEYADYLKNFKSDGRFEFNTTIKGKLAARMVPEVEVNFSIRNGKLAPADAPAALENINCSGTFLNKTKNGRGALIIPELSATLSGHRIKADLRLDDLPHALLTIHANAQLDLAEVKPFIKSDTLESLRGNIAINVFYSGHVKELTAHKEGEPYQVNASGNIDISHVSFSLKNNPLVFNDLNGNFQLQNNDMIVRNFNGKISSSDFTMTGTFRNWLSFLLIPGQPGDFIAKVKSEKLDLDELLVNKSTTVSGDTSYIMKFNPRLICDLDMNVQKLQFRKFHATDLHGNIDLERQVISGRNLTFNAMSGSVSMDAKINAARRDSVIMSCDAKFNKLDVTRLFYELENFDQSTMTDKNVKGNVSAEVNFSSSWTTDLTINSSKVITTADIIIDNGELINFAPIQALARYVKVPDLNHIRFSTLKNKISIANRKILIPEMEIKSTALNIGANGVHDFDNNVDYHLQLFLSEILGKKMKSNSTEFGEVEDDGLGRSRLMLTMKGPVDNPRFAYDRKATTAKIKNDISNEKQNLKAMLKEEFGIFKKDTITASRPKKKEEMQIDWGIEEQ